MREMMTSVKGKPELTVTVDVLVVSLMMSPMYEQTPEVIESTERIGIQLLEVAMELESDAERSKLVGLIYIIGKVSNLQKILEHKIVIYYLSFFKGKELMPAEIFEYLRKDKDHYWNWIAPFVENVGIKNIDEVVEEVDAIQKMIGGRI